MTTSNQILTGRHILTDSGRDTGATYDIETSRAGVVSVVFHSRGTTAGSKAYRAGLELLLARVGDLVSEVCVETRTTKGLSKNERRIYKAPCALLSRARLGSAAAKVGRSPDAKGGGNGTKRLRIYLVQTTPAAADPFAEWISRGR